MVKDSLKKKRMEERDFRKKLDEYFRDKSDFAKHYYDGNVSCWMFGYPGGHTVLTGDGGALEIMNLLKEKSCQSLVQYLSSILTK
jgi:hypothetical protein